MSSKLWEPKHPKQSKMWQFMRTRNFEDYQSLHTWSVEHPELFWLNLYQFLDLHFDEAPTQILSDYQNLWDAQWFIGAKFNFAQQLLSRQDDHLAIISLNEMSEKKTLTYKELYIKVAQCAAGLSAFKVSKGDRVAGFLPNTAESIIAMLATTSLGAIWSSCSPDFGADAAIDRFSQINPKVLFICDGHQYHGKRYASQDKIKQLQHIAEKIVIVPNLNEPISLQNLTHLCYWDDFLKPASLIEFQSLPFNHPLYLLFSSGTTGKPKCIIHSAGGTLLQHLKELSLHCNLTELDNLCFYTTCGWMMWNWMVSALALGSTLTLYEGSPTYPQNNRLFQLISQEKVTVFGTSAKYLATMEHAKVKPEEEFDLTHLHTILSTGSPLLPKSYDYVYENVKTDILLSSISGGTDIISCFALGNPILPVYRGEIQCLGLGMAVAVFDEQARSVIVERGELVCTKPFPSMPLGFWNDPEGLFYRKAYFTKFPGVWTHGDFALITTHHGLIIYGRSDTLLNPGGVRIGTAEIYRQLDKVDAIIDSVVIGQNWQDDVRLVLFVMLQNGLILDDDLREKIRYVLRQNASPRHVPAKIIQVRDIPRTINGKLAELAVRQVVHGESVNNVSSLANPHSLSLFKNIQELND